MSSSSEKRQLFDQVALGCISYLETCEFCRGVVFSSVGAATSYELSSWDKKNAPCKLPEDLKRFYSIFNGFSVSWSVEIAGKIVPIGEMSLNKIEAFEKSKADFFVHSSDLPNELKPPQRGSCSLFVLDSQNEAGEIVLLYRESDPSSKGRDTKLFPEIWLLEPSGRLHYICDSFTQYLRLLVAHLGIHGWPLAFTEDGLPEVTQQWMALFCRERLVVDRHYHKTRKQAIKMGKS